MKFPIRLIPDDTRLPGLRMLTVFTTVSVFLLAILASAALWLPGTSLIDSLAKGIS